MALAEGWSVGGELVKMGLVPAYCTEMRITCTTEDVLTIETKSFLTQVQWDQFMVVVKSACANGQVSAAHTTINIETGEVVES
jgi:hypothetical protein